MERIKVLTGAEIESDYQEPESMDARVVMGQEALLKNMETQIGAVRGRKTGEESSESHSSQPSSQEEQTWAEEKLKLDTGQEGPTADQDKSLTLTPEQKKSLNQLLECPVPEPEAADTALTESSTFFPDDERDSLSLSQGEVPSLSFSEPSYAVDPHRIGVLPGLDPDRYYTAPSTPIKMAYCSHLKQQWHPSSPSTGPGSPADESDLCSPPTSPSGSYITAEGGSWTSSYTSSTSHSCSPNLIAEAELQEAPACYVGSLSEIGDELGDERPGADREHCVCKPSMPGLVEDVEYEEDRIRRETCRPHWVTENVSPHRSSSGRSTDSQEGLGASETSLIQEEIQRATDITQPFDDPDQDLELDLEACVSEHFARLEAPLSLEEDFPPDLASSFPFSHRLATASTALETGSLTPATCSSEISDTDNNSLYSEMGSSALFFHGYSRDDGPRGDGMIPASMLPVHASLIFQADSMEITLFPTDDEPENDVDAYAAGEEEGDVDEYDDEDEDDDINDDNYLEEQAEAMKPEARNGEDPNEEDTSASFLNSLSENSINEGVDESFAYQDDTEESIDSTSCNGDEDDNLYGTERHAELALQFPGQDDHQSITHARPESSGSESEMEISSESSELQNIVARKQMPICTSAENVIMPKPFEGECNETVSLAIEIKEQTEEGRQSADLKDTEETDKTWCVESQQTSHIRTQESGNQTRSADLQKIIETCSTPTLCMLGATASCMDLELNIQADQELDQKNGNNSEFLDTLLQFDETATNDLNKGVPLLSYPKDDCSPTNIPVCAYPELSEIADNLTPADISPFEHSLDQDNLTENQGTEDVSLGSLNMSTTNYSMLAISPKKENSENSMAGRNLSLVGWAPAEPLSLGECCDFEAENLLMCEIAGSLPNKGLSVTPNIAAGDDIMGDLEDNNTYCDLPEKMADLEAGMLEANLSTWRSIEDLSEAGGGEDDANILQNPDSNPLIQCHSGKILVTTWNDTEKSVQLTLNVLSDDGKDEKEQTPNTEFNIPGEAISNICKDESTDISAKRALQVQASAQELDEAQTPVLTSSYELNDLCGPPTTTDMADDSNSPVCVSDSFLSQTHDILKQTCMLNTESTVSENVSVFKLEGGSFGTFTPRKKLSESKFEILSSDKSLTHKETRTSSDKESQTRQTNLNGRHSQCNITRDGQQQDYSDQMSDTELTEPKTETEDQVNEKDVCIQLKEIKNDEAAKVFPKEGVDKNAWEISNQKEERKLSLSQKEAKEHTAEEVKEDAADAVPSLEMNQSASQQSNILQREVADSDHDLKPKLPVNFDTRAVSALEEREEIQKKECLFETQVNQAAETANISQGKTSNEAHQQPTAEKNEPDQAPVQSIFHPRSPSSSQERQDHTTGSVDLTKSDQGATTDQQKALHHSTLTRLELQASTRDINDNHVESILTAEAESSDQRGHSPHAIPVLEEDLPTPIQESQPSFDRSHSHSPLTHTESTANDGPCQQRPSHVTNVDVPSVESKEELSASFPIQDTHQNVNERLTLQTKSCRQGNPEGKQYIK